LFFRGDAVGRDVGFRALGGVILLKRLDGTLSWCLGVTIIRNLYKISEIWGGGFSFLLL